MLLEVIFTAVSIITFTYYIEYERLLLKVPYTIWGLTICLNLVWLWALLVWFYGCEMSCIL